MSKLNTSAVYSTLIGGYENLTELTFAKEPGIDYLLFTDNPKLTSKTWQVICIEKTWPLDNVRSQRALKTIGHPMLEKYETTLYIDNNVVLKKPASELFSLLPPNAEISFAYHSSRETLQEEFEAVRRQRLDSLARITEQNNHYQQLWPEVLDERPIWGGMILRRNTEAVKNFNRIWYEHILRYSRRDQLSLLVALKLAMPQISYFDLDHEESEYHYRDHAIRLVTREQSRASEPDFEHEIASLKNKVKQLESSFSWRITKPLRALTRALKQKR